MIAHNQLPMADIFSECETIFNEDQPAFLTLLQDTIDLDKIVPYSFVCHFYKQTGRPHSYSLYSMLWALILQRIFSISEDTLLLLFLNYSQPLREFCGFNRVTHASQITRFKQEFLPDLKLFFERLVEQTEPICKRIDPAKAAMTIFDTSGVEAFVTENNPKYSTSLIKKFKAFQKALELDETFDPYKAAYAAFPPHAASHPAIQQMYINGHFCYAYKFGVITNGLGIVRDLSFFYRDFLDSHPEIVLEKKSNSPDEDKSLSDSKALIPILKDYFHKHPSFEPDLFLGDSAFDSIKIYHDLFDQLGFQQAFIPINGRLSLPAADCPLNEDGIPCCPKDVSLPMKREGSKSHLRCGLPTMKFVCPKMKWTTIDGKSKRRTFCKNPCTDSPCGRMFYVYPEKNLRAWPGTERGTPRWGQTYKIRATIERTIGRLKDSGCAAGRKSRDSKTLHADLLLARISQLLTVLVADRIHQYQCFRSLKPLFAA